MPDLMLNLDGKALVSDLGIANGDLQVDDGLQTAVIMSLFCNARAEDTDILPDGETSRRGYWADTPDDRMGSKLWLLGREKMLPAVAARARQYVQEALAWMVNTGVAATVEVETELQQPNMLKIGITITRGTNRDYDYLWLGLAKQANHVAALVPVPSASVYRPTFSLNFATGQYELIT